MKGISKEMNTPTVVTVAPRFKVLQWNVQGLLLKGHQLLQAIFKESRDVVPLLQTFNAS